MSIVMLGRATKNLGWTVFWYALGLFLYGLMILSIFPAVQRHNDQFQKLLSNYPRSLLQAFGVSTDLGSLSNFLGGELLNVIWPLIASIFVIMAGSALVAQEIERGTVELWLSVPRSRAQLLSAKMVALLGGIVVIVIATMLSFKVGAKLVSVFMPWSALPPTGVVLAAFAVTVAGYSALFSALSSSRGRAAGLAAALTVFFYVAWVIAGLSDRWSWLKHVSIFAAYQPQSALETGIVPGPGTAVLFAVGLVCAIAALVIFQRRDVIA